MGPTGSYPRLRPGLRPVVQVEKQVQAPPPPQLLLIPEASPWHHPLSPLYSEREKGKGLGREGRGGWPPPELCQFPVLVSLQACRRCGEPETSSVNRAVGIPLQDSSVHSSHNLTRPGEPSDLPGPLLDSAGGTGRVWEALPLPHFNFCLPGFNFSDETAISILRLSEA